MTSAHNGILVHIMEKKLGCGGAAPGVNYILNTVSPHIAVSYLYLQIL